MCTSWTTLLKRFTISFSISVLPGLTFAQHYQQTNLVSNLHGVAKVVDPNLQNPWGLVSSAGSPWWVSNEYGGTSTLYDGNGKIQHLVVRVPAASGNGTGTPTGILFNGTGKFLLAPKKPAIFLFVTLDGTISGWNPGVSPANAVVVVNNSSKGAVYTGATISEVGENKEQIFVANFHTGRVEVYDSKFKPVRLPRGAFVDGSIPEDFAPFNIQGIGPNIYVTYARQNGTKTFPTEGPGEGFVDVYSPQGVLLSRLQHGSWLNAPWGVVLAPEYFGEFSHTILVGNFLGSGTIAAYNPVTGTFLGNVLTSTGETLGIPGLWALVFGNGAKAGPANTLYFTAGPEGVNGILGTLTPVAAELNEDDEQ
ncbi:MAG: TIGR03118 family protein [Acidobacteriaceae bacterium]|nr:TIGR03118 family protein [Acidobacteriaceae bacterium]